MSEQKSSTEFGEIQRADVPETDSGPMVSLKAVLNLVDDWAADYITPVSWQPSTKQHVDAAVGNLRERLKGLLP